MRCQRLLSRSYRGIQQQPPPDFLGAGGVGEVIGICPCIMCPPFIIFLRTSCDHRTFYVRPSGPPDGAETLQSAWASALQDVCERANPSCRGHLIG
jgi:hypothetical protein